MTRSPRFSPGDRHVYAFAFTVDERVNGGALLSSDAPLEAAMDLAGEIAVGVGPTDADGTWLAIRITRLDRHDVVALGESLMPDPAVLLAHDVWVHVPIDGSARRVLVPAEAPPIVRLVIDGLLTQIDLRTPDRSSGAWRADIPTVLGVADAQYVVANDTTRRTLKGYRRFDATLDGPHEQPDTSGHAIIERDPDGMPTRMHGEEVLEVRKETIPALRSTTTFQLERTRVEAGPRLHRPAEDTMLELDLFAPPDPTDSERAIAQRFAGSLDIGGLEIAVRSLDNGLRPRRGFMMEAVGLLVGWPEHADALLPMFLDAERTEARALVLDLLASAGTDRAQQVMLALYARQDVRADDAYPDYLQRWSFVRRPIPEAVRHLVDVHAEAIARGDDEIARAVLYPIGSVSDRLEASDPASAALLHTLLHEALVNARDEDTIVAALAGIGNARRFEPRVLDHLSSPSPRLRLAAVRSLRDIPVPPARAALMKALHDDHATIAEQATEILTAWDRGKA